MIQYQERVGADAGVASITWVNDEGYSCFGTREARKQALNASLREATVVKSATGKGDPHAESRRMIQGYRQNKLPKVKLVEPDHEEIPDQRQPEDKPLITRKEKPPARSVKDSSSPTKALKEGEEEKPERGQTK